MFVTIMYYWKCKDAVDCLWLLCIITCVKKFQSFVDCRVFIIAGEKILSVVGGCCVFIIVGIKIFSVVGDYSGFIIEGV